MEKKSTEFESTDMYTLEKMKVKNKKWKNKNIRQNEAPKPFFFEHSNLVAAVIEGDEGSQGIEFYAKDLDKHYFMDIMQDDLAEFLIWVSSVEVWMKRLNRNQA